MAVIITELKDVNSPMQESYGGCRWPSTDAGLTVEVKAQHVWGGLKGNVPRKVKPTFTLEVGKNKQTNNKQTKGFTKNSFWNLDLWNYHSWGKLSNPSSCKLQSSHFDSSWDNSDAEGFFPWYNMLAGWTNTDQYFFCFFYNCIAPLGFLPWENWVAFPTESQLRQSCNPTYHACWLFQCFCNSSNSDKDYKIFNVRIAVNACDCAKGCMNTVRESEFKADSGRKIPCRIRESNQPQWHTGPTLHQLSHHLIDSCDFSYTNFHISLKCANIKTQILKKI